MRSCFKIYTGILFYFGVTLTTAVAQPFEIKLAGTCFQEAKSISDKDNGSLWGIRLYGPLIFVNEKTREGYANQVVPVSGWTETDGVFTGKVPDDIGLANTAFRWGNAVWSMVMTDYLSGDSVARRSIIMHELWHQHEGQFGFLSHYDQAVHLNEKEGRALLFLEWNALLKACETDSSVRREAIRDALSFRKLRLKIYPAGRLSETARDLHEGMAEYTGMKLCGIDRKGKLLLLEQKVKSRDFGNTVVWTYAYISGPLYGFLLDEAISGWARTLQKETDLGEMLASAYRVGYDTADLAGLSSTGSIYGFDSIFYAETQRVDKTRARQEAFKKRFQQEKILFLPNHNLQIQFNPAQITPFDTVGAVYGSLTGQSAWGEIRVDSVGILLLKGWKGLVIDLEQDWNPDHGLTFKGWSLTLNIKYEIIPSRDGWAVARKKE